jgi:TRAP transporter TAXI family solute receptor
VKKRTLIATALTAITLFSVAPASAQQNAKFITIGTGGITGVYYPLGGAICRFVNQNRKDHGMRCTVESTGGSVFNVNALAAGDIEVGFTQSDVQYQAMKGEGGFKDKSQPKLRALFSLYPELFTLVARQDAKITKFEDIKGKRVNLADPGSGTRATMELLMKEYGIKAADLKLATELKPSEAPSALCDNKIDAYVFIAGHPSANFQEAATTCASNIATVSGPVVDKLVKANSYYTKASVSAKMYKGTDNEQETFGMMATVVVSADLPESNAYAITKAVFDNFEDFKKLHPAMARATKEQALVGNSVPFHPGAAKYFKEKGLMK